MGSYIAMTLYSGLDEAFGILVRYEGLQVSWTGVVLQLGDDIMVLVVHPCKASAQAA